MSNNVEVFLEICREGAVIPKYAKQWDAGMDICAAEDVIISPGETVIIPTGLKVAIPEGYEIQVRPRSGISLKTPLRISNSPGTIDSGYRDEIGIIVTNTSAVSCNEDTSSDLEELTIDSKGNKQGVYRICKGDRIAQIVLQYVPRIQFKVVDSVKEIGSDRGGGFGSTGVRE
ncbi:dUTP diphosphatase [Acetivibrio mesophilus]|uniref:dUTP diphosphatase n=1 Tax=Acetivibrio mesophilus TaxID=2487273 RepID=A0A4Q0I8I3_9FIRM|nr:dUTP diphosphatase [Acetivibrio mesophilus]ODM26822.1 aminotransferase [Clostridium sp. Bc-iso-3]RXE59312.1 dUTP diphosphatase [Acetivibrio mesophilus]HHV28387.1 dUTP diphosphatase [Clostridium sp.]